MKFGRPLVVKLLCVGFVACLMLPFGRAVFPQIEHTIGGLSFSAMEAVTSAALGFVLYAVLAG
jgi:hypothetical protein